MLQTLKDHRLRQLRRLASSHSVLTDDPFAKPLSFISTTRFLSTVNFIFLILVFLAAAGRAQESRVPNEIDGYKLHRTKIQLSRSPTVSGTGDTPARIKFGEPKLVDASLTGVSFEVSVEASPLPVSGTIDFFTFENFHINGIPVEIEKFEGPVPFKKGVSFVLPRPVKLFMSNGGILEVVWNQLKNEQDKWLVKGRMLAFGSFRKMGLTFKRVVPVDVSVLIKNPLPRTK